jgi:hypothetical protein
MTREFIMTLSATTKANRKNAKKSTGPKSMSGKLAISKNAITHGVNTKTFINDAEENEYQTLVHELKATYPSSNPLVRIAEEVTELVQLEELRLAHERCEMLENDEKVALWNLLESRTRSSLKKYKTEK